MGSEHSSIWPNAAVFLKKNAIQVLRFFQKHGHFWYHFAIFLRYKTFSRRDQNSICFVSTCVGLQLLLSILHFLMFNVRSKSEIIFNGSQCSSSGNRSSHGRKYFCKVLQELLRMYLLLLHSISKRLLVLHISSYSLFCFHFPADVSVTFRPFSGVIDFSKPSAHHNCASS